MAVGFPCRTTEVGLRIRVPLCLHGLHNYREALHRTVLGESRHDSRSTVRFRQTPNDPEPKDPTAISAAGVPMASGLFLAVRKRGIGGRSIAIL
jgi:hypothetical protein